MYPRRSGVLYRIRSKICLDYSLRRSMHSPTERSASRRSSDKIFRAPILRRSSDNPTVRASANRNESNIIPCCLSRRRSISSPRVFPAVDDSQRFAYLRESRSSGRRQLLLPLNLRLNLTYRSSRRCLLFRSSRRRRLLRTVRCFPRRISVPQQR